MTGVGWLIASQTFLSTAAAKDSGGIIVGTVQGQDLRRVDQAMVQVRDQEGNLVVQTVTNQAGEFRVVGAPGRPK
jgi:hypothetical protein